MSPESDVGGDDTSNVQNFLAVSSLGLKTFIDVRI